MILINRCYSETTPESAESGDFSDTGFIAQDEPVTFRELVEVLRSHPVSSCWPASGDVHTWFSTYPETDYRTGTEREESVHFSRENPPHKAKYWEKAARVAAVNGRR